MGPKNEITHVLLVFLILRWQAEENEVFQPAAPKYGIGFKTASGRRATERLQPKASQSRVVDPEDGLDPR